MYLNKFARRIWLRDWYPIFLHPLQVKFDRLMDELRNRSPGLADGDTPWQKTFVVSPPK